MEEIYINDNSTVSRARTKLCNVAVTVPLL